VALALGTLVLGTAANAEVLFWSTQAQPVEETQKMRENVLSGFAGGAEYQASEGGPWLTRLQAERRLQCAVRGARRVGPGRADRGVRRHPALDRQRRGG
jgi:hypothetical protein